MDSYATAHLAAIARYEWEITADLTWAIPANACDSPVSTFSDSSSQWASSPPPVNSAPARRGSQSKKKGPGHIARPPNAFLIFRSDFWALEKKKPKPVERDHRDISRIAAHCWANLDPDTKAHYHARAHVLKEEHKLRYPEYRLTPSARRNRTPKQKSAIVLQKEHRCRVLANELMATTDLTVHDPSASPVSQTYIPGYMQAHLDVNMASQSNMVTFQPSQQFQVATLIAPKPMHPAIHGHGFIIEQDTDLPVPLAPSTHTPPLMAECMDALSTLPPLPSCDIAAMDSFSTDEEYQPTWPSAGASYSYPSASAPDYGIYLSPNQPLAMAMFPEELLYPQDSAVDQGRYIQDSYQFQYYSQ